MVQTKVSPSPEVKTQCLQIDLLLARQNAQPTTDEFEDGLRRNQDCNFAATWNFQNSAAIQQELRSSKFTRTNIKCPLNRIPYLQRYPLPLVQPLHLTKHRQHPNISSHNGSRH